MRNLATILATSAIAVGLSLSVHAASVTLESGPERVSLVELYTSEGCSSCPPADKWVSALRDDTRLWHQFVPVAFHVDYWDYIGWKDRFAEAAYSARQRSHASLGNVRSVYTPGFVVNGAEWRAWFRRAPLPLPNDKPGRLRAIIEGDTVEVTYAPSAAIDGRFEIVVARLGFDLSSQIKAGENAGKYLAHDFVVLGVTKTTLQQGADEHAARLKLPATDHAGGAAGLAVWVTAPGQQRPIQALGGYLRTP